MFVIFALTFIVSLTGCFSASSKHEKQIGSASAQDFSQNYQKPQVVGKIESREITESSGLVASRCNENVFWTHNDSGDGAFVFALNAKGENLGVYKITGAKNKDWEDIAAFKNAQGKCFLYLGDIGDNKKAKSVLTIYRVREPKVSDADKNSTRKNPQATDAAEAIKFEYPDAPHNAETLLVHPQTGDIYILSKDFDAAAGVYKLPANYDLNKTNRLEKIADITVPSIPNGLLTGGDVSPDGKRIILCDYSAAYEIVLPNTAKSFDEIWREKPLTVELGDREQGEAVCYSADGKSIYATSEKEDSPMIEVRRK